MGQRLLMWSGGWDFVHNVRGSTMSPEQCTEGAHKLAVMGGVM